MLRSMGDTEFLRAVELRLARVTDKRGSALKKEDAVRVWSIAKVSSGEIEAYKKSRADLQGTVMSRDAQIHKLDAEAGRLGEELRRQIESNALLQKQMYELNQPKPSRKTINESIAGIGRELRETVNVCNNSGMADAALAFQHVVVALGAAEDAATEADAGDAVLDV